MGAVPKVAFALALRFAGDEPVGGQILKHAADGASRQPERGGDVGGLDGLALFDGLVGGAAQRRGRVQRDRQDDVHRPLALDPERIEAGEQPLQCEPDAGGALGAVDRFDLARSPVTLDRPAQAHRQGNGIADAVDAHRC